MPTYEFRCPQGHEFERFYKTISGAASEAPCPECGAIALRRLSAGGGLVFKGSGFYLTDYGKNAHRKPGPSEGTSQKTDAKADATADANAGSKEAKADSSAASKSDAGKPADAKSNAPSPKPKSE